MEEFFCFDRPGRPEVAACHRYFVFSQSLIPPSTAAHRNVLNGVAFIEEWNGRKEFMFHVPFLDDNDIITSIFAKNCRFGPQSQAGVFRVLSTVQDEDSEVSFSRLSSTLVPDLKAAKWIQVFPPENVSIDVEVHAFTYCELNDSFVIFGSDNTVFFVDSNGDAHLFPIKAKAGVLSCDGKTLAVISPDSSFVSFVDAEPPGRKHDVGRMSINAEENSSFGVSEMLMEEFGKQAEGHWNAGSSEFAFLQMDSRDCSLIEGNVYPFPGQCLPKFSLVVADMERRLNIPIMASPFEITYIVQYGWVTDNILFAVQLSRNHRELIIAIIDVSLAELRWIPVLHTSSTSWIYPPTHVTFLSDGRLVTTSEHSGFRHIIVVHADGTIDDVTSGPFEVTHNFHVTSLSSDSPGDSEVIFYHSRMATPLETQVHWAPLPNGRSSWAGNVSCASIQSVVEPVKLSNLSPRSPRSTDPDPALLTFRGRTWDCLAACSGTILLRGSSLNEPAATIMVHVRNKTCSPTIIYFEDHGSPKHDCRDALWIVASEIPIIDSKIIVKEGQVLLYSPMILEKTFRCQNQEMEATPSSLSVKSQLRFGGVTRNHFLEGMAQAPAFNFFHSPPDIFCCYNHKGDILHGMFFPPLGTHRSPPPVALIVYAGPGKQMVTNSEALSLDLLPRLLSALGISVLLVNSASAAGKGRYTEQCYDGCLGQQELLDQVVALDHLTSSGRVDPQRIAVIGWSYGGYASLALLARYPSLFKMAVAGVPVLDWAKYSAVYSERYLGDPRLHPRAYAASSALNLVDDLPSDSDRLLLVRCGDDRNVLPAQTDSLISSLIRLNKPYSLLSYPHDGHQLCATSQAHYEVEVASYVSKVLC